MRTRLLPLFALVAATAAIVAGCAPAPVLPIDVRPGMTINQALDACRKAGVNVQGPTASGPMNQYLETYELSDGRRLNLVTDHTKSPPIVLSANVRPTPEATPDAAPEP